MLREVCVKHTDTHQYLHATSCHVYHFKTSTPYSQALCFNRICSKNQFFDKKCNDLEGWLKNRGYNEKLVRQQMLKVGNIGTVFNITYCPIFSKFKNILSKINLPLTLDKEHSKDSEKVSIIDFKKEKSLKDILVTGKVPPL